MSRKIIPFKNSNDDTPRRLNIGCGRHYHADWVNLDLQSNDPSVICHDVTQGIPFSENTFDVVYHSHILEHLSPQQGCDLVTDCFRVLKPEGVLRIVVPDLEGIVRLYMEMHHQSWEGDEQAQVNYHWMKMELLDQMVRTQSGGLMGPYMAEIREAKADFVKSRIGSEFHLCRAPDVEPQVDQSQKSLWTRFADGAGVLKSNLAKRLVRLLMGSKAELAFEESLFRSQGEIHRWMYDRYSLRELCRSAGFVGFEVSSAFQSQIEGYRSFQLDSFGDEIRKPDSLFVECRKPAAAMKASA